jgi:hypothetical protein
MSHNVDQASDAAVHVTNIAQYGIRPVQTDLSVARRNDVLRGLNTCAVANPCRNRLSPISAVALNLTAETIVAMQAYNTACHLVRFHGDRDLLDAAEAMEYAFAKIPGLGRRRPDVAQLAKPIVDLNPTHQPCTRGALNKSRMLGSGAIRVPH